MLGKKRKRSSMAICIKDGHVYMKPFSEIRQFSSPPNSNMYRTSGFNNMSEKPIGLQPSKPGLSQAPMFGQQLTVQQLQLAQNQRHQEMLRQKQEMSRQEKQLQDRLRNLPPGLKVQQTDSTSESRRVPVYEALVDDEDSVDKDSVGEEVHSDFSDEPEELNTSGEQVLDGTAEQTNYTSSKPDDQSDDDIEEVEESGVEDSDTAAQNEAIVALEEVEEDASEDGDCDEEMEDRSEDISAEEVNEDISERPEVAGPLNTEQSNSAESTGNVIDEESQAVPVIESPKDTDLAESGITAVNAENGSDNKEQNTSDKASEEPSI